MKSLVRYVLTTLVLLSLALTGCAATATPGAPQATAAAGDTPVPAETAGTSDCGTVELQYWNPFTGPDGPFMGQMVDAFNAEHGEDITVVMTTQSDYYTQIATTAASETLPDVAIMHADQVATHAYRGVLRSMDDLVAEA